MSSRAGGGFLFALALVAVLAACGGASERPADGAARDADGGGASAMQDRLAKYTTVTLTTDVGALTEGQRRMIPLLIEAAREMDALFWIQAYGDRQALLDSIDDPDARRYAEYNYGPWDRLEGNEPFIEGVGPKPEGANLYPADMTREEFEAAAAEDEALRGLYTLVRRNAAGKLEAVPYHVAFAERLERAAGPLREAAALASDPGLRAYLEARAKALTTDDYRPSDLAWMDMKHNTIDVVIGAIENYEDKLFGYKAAYETFVLVKDKDWSERLARYAKMLPGLQRGLPVPDRYKREQPGRDADLNAYDVVYYAGDCNAGSKTIAINLPNDETVQLEKGTRRLQLKNTMRAKFDEILVPISEHLIAADQRQHVSFDAFFGNTMFHEVAHGLGIKNTLDGKGTVRHALQEEASALEEGKADVLGLYMVTSLHGQGEIDIPLEQHYVTFLASVFRSIRFGAASAHGRANLARFNFFREMGAFSRDEQTGTYSVDFERMNEAVNALSARILELQGDGDYEGAKAFMGEKGRIGERLRADLDRLAAARIPVDIVFEQGVEVLGLAR